MRKAWTSEDIDTLKSAYADQPMSTICAALGRTDAAIRAKASLLGLRRLDSPDIAERHTKHSRHMKNRRLSGIRNPHRAPVGTDQMHGNRLMRKISDTGDTHVDWVPSSRAAWEQAHGKIPNGMVIRLKDGNPSNVSLDNLELLTTSERMSRNTIARYPLDYQRSAQDLGRFIAKLRKIEAENEKSE
ncbi:HNH endonuclease signature motif containing protein [Pseudomonas bohemica]|uniref:HNH endonuclease signature motif containing protein n=1 Tax=Pseudomonas bohemica TaxID=2044872 RepID=UPI0018FF0683|nr:HNH endonuclease signature motif containing protein [Pseudomonas bohemica]